MDVHTPIKQDTINIEHGPIVLWNHLSQMAYFYGKLECIAIPQEGIYLLSLESVDLLVGTLLICLVFLMVLVGLFNWCLDVVEIHGSLIPIKVFTGSLR